MQQSHPHPLTLTTLFLVDTSASMNQKAHTGLSLLDIAKSGIEAYAKLRKDMLAQLKNPRLQEQYLLVTCAETDPVKCDWGTTHDEFEEVVKNLVAKDMSDLGTALAISFELLNKPHPNNKRHYENYGKGINIWDMHPCIIVVLTDGGEFTGKEGIKHPLTLPNRPVPGSELNIMPYRWDQRVHLALIQCSGTWPPVIDPKKPRKHPIARYCDFTGGNHQIVNGGKNLIDYLTSICNMHTFSKPMVYCKFKNLDPNGELKTYRHHIAALKPPEKMCGLYPLPESYLPAQNQSSIPKRECPPTILYDLKNPVPLHVNRLVTSTNSNCKPDFYAFNGKSPLTEKIIQLNAENKSQMFCVYVHNSLGDGTKGKPCGYIQVYDKKAHVIMHMYDFPEFLQLMRDLKDMSFKINQAWFQRYQGYLSSIPFYYHKIAHQNFQRYGVTPPTVNFQNIGFSRQCQDYIHCVKVDINNIRKEKKRELVEEKQKATKELVDKRLFVTKRGKKNYLGKAEAGDSGAASMNTAVARVIEWDPFKISREHLFEAVQLMRENVLSSSFSESMRKKNLNKVVVEENHSKPIVKMGDYQQFWKFLKECGQAPLRDPLSDDPEASRWKISNPYVKNTKSNRQRMVRMVDEADVAGMNAPNNFGQNRSRSPSAFPGIRTPGERRALKRKRAIKYFPGLFPSQSRQSSPQREPSPKRSKMEAQDSSDISSSSTQRTPAVGKMGIPSSRPKPYKRGANGKLHDLENLRSTNLSTEPIVRGSREWPIQRKKFWAANDLQNLRLKFTKLLRESQQNARSGSLLNEFLDRLQHMRGNLLFFEEFVDILLSQAKEYKQSYLVEFLSRKPDEAMSNGVGEQTLDGSH